MYNIHKLLLIPSHLLYPDQQDRLCDAVLKLISKCMAFDFIGTTPDESGEDSGTIQVRTRDFCLYPPQPILISPYQDTHKLEVLD
jgi:hypothetical protein